jgi:hypothetical protein
MWLTALLPLLGNLLEKFFPDPVAAAEAKLKLTQMAADGELAQLNADMQIVLGQLEINKVEAAGGFFKSGWRPAAGWTCVAAFAWNYVLGPMIVNLLEIAGHHVAFTPLDMTEMMPVLFGLLGLGGYRAIERIKGKA